VELWVKAEWFNPAGSVKDRPARSILLGALEQGMLAEGQVLLDSTSGNMGTAYATFGAALGVRVHLAVPANAGPARLGHLRALGAEITLTDPLEGSDGARVVAAGMAHAQPDRYFYADQYANPGNWKAHYSGTGPELLAQTQGRITHFVSGLGTTGTMTGTGRFLREASPQVLKIAVQPDGPLHGLEGLKHLASSPVPPIFDDKIPDETRQVSTEQAYEMARQLARREGLLVGPSGGACAWAALDVARSLKRGVVVALIPDSGFKYLDTPLWNSR
jgi:cysteine synthase B